MSNLTKTSVVSTNLNMRPPKILAEKAGLAPGDTVTWTNGSDANGEYLLVRLSSKGNGVSSRPRVKKVEEAV
jgi:bifunctional DNA-binding transcriptional regulator/antitoxin component of YhaV-PrlF toxin-antitoxin module